MLSPKKTKYRKWFRNRSGMKGVALRGNEVSFGDCGLRAMEKGEINSRQIESARKTMTRYLKRGGKLWIRIFPHKPITQKAAEVPMGAGKGNVEYYVASIKPGTMLFEMGGLPENEAKEALELASYKLPIQTRYSKPAVR